MFYPEYVAIYEGCEDFLIGVLNISKEELRQFLISIFETEVLKKYYNALCEETVGLEDPIVILDVAHFIHMIDHYDDLIQDELRDKTGSYYTPQEIVDMMVDGLFMEGTLIEKLESKLPIDMLEPSCGTMTFVRAYLRKVKSLVSDGAYFTECIGHINVVDIQPQPLILGALALVYEIYTLSGEWAIPWKVQCQDTLNLNELDGQMDLVLGNPPYLGEKGNKAFFRRLKEQVETAPYYVGRMDLYYFFIHKGLNALKNNGLLSFITTNYFVTADSGHLLRKHIEEEGVFRRIIDYSGDGLFKSARGQHNIAFVIEKKQKNKRDLCEIVKVGQLKDHSLVEISSKGIEEYKLYDGQGLISLNDDSQVHLLLEKIKMAASGLLVDHYDVKQGIVSGADAVTRRMFNSGLLEETEVIKKGTPIYVFPKEMGQPFEGPWRNFYKNSDIGHYKIMNNPTYKIYYLSEDYQPSKEGLAYLQQFRSVLMARREVALGYRKWYELQWPRTCHLFEQPKIVMPQRGRENVFAYTEGPFYGSADIYYIIHHAQDKASLKYLNGIINSKLYYFWLYHRGKKKGPLLELYSTPIKNLPIIHYEGFAWQNEIIKWVETIMESDRFDLSEQIDSLLYEGFSLTNDEIDKIERLYRRINN
jgi:adenine-specific DNA-methyltransferase